MSGEHSESPADAGVDPDQENRRWRTVDVGADLDVLQSADALEYDEERRRYRLAYDSSSDPPSMAVVATVAAVTYTDPNDLPPLGSRIDVDALDAICADRPSDGDGAPVRASFRYDGIDVMVDNREVKAAITEKRV